MYRHINERVGDPLPHIPKGRFQAPKTSTTRRKNGVQKKYSTRSSQERRKSWTKPEADEKKKWWEDRPGTDRIYNTKIAATGLRNVGNSCYLNATVQALASVTPFTETILQRMENEEKPETENLTDVIGNLVKDIRTGEYRYITPHRLNETVKQTSNGRFANGRQEDGHELLVYMMDEMHEETKGEGEGSVIEQTFRGKMETKLRCTRCSKERSAYQNFDYVFLTMPEQEGKVTLEDCFKKLEREDIIEVDCEYCMGEKAKQKCQIGQYPPHGLILHLKRYGQDGEKDNKLVNFPLTYKEFQLTAVIEHIGSNQHSGHYTTKCWNVLKEKWYLTDDQFTREIDERRLVSENACTLMYVRKDNAEILSSKVDSDTEDGAIGESCNQGISKEKMTERTAATAEEGERKATEMELTEESDLQEESLIGEENGAEESIIGKENGIESCHPEGGGGNGLESCRPETGEVRPATQEESIIVIEEESGSTSSPPEIDEEIRSADEGSTTTAEAEKEKEKEENKNQATEVTDKRNRKPTLKAKKSLNTGINIKKPPKEGKATGEKKEPDECMKCGKYTENGVFCVVCRRWFHYTCVPEAEDKIHLVKDYKCKEHLDEEKAKKKVGRKRDGQQLEEERKNKGKVKDVEMKKAKVNSEELNRVKDERQQSVNQIKMMRERLTQTKQEKDAEIKQTKKESEERRKEILKLQKQNSITSKEKQKEMEKAEEKEKLHQEAKEIIDAKEEKIREIEEDLREKIEENKRWRIKYDFYFKYWEQHQQEEESARSENKEGAEHGNPTLEGMSLQTEAKAAEGLNPAKEIEKLEEKNGKYHLDNQELKKNNKELQKKADDRQASIKDLIGELNETKKKCMILEEEKRSLISINCMLELEIGELDREENLKQVKNLLQENEEIESAKTLQREDKRQEEETNSPEKQGREEIRQAEDEQEGRKTDSLARTDEESSQLAEEDSDDGEDDAGDKQERSSNDKKGNNQDEKGEKIEKGGGRESKEGEPSERRKYHPSKEEDQGSKRAPKNEITCKNGPNCHFEKKGYCRYSHIEESCTIEASMKRIKEKRSEIMCENGGECYYNKHGWCRYKHSEEKAANRSSDNRDGKLTKDGLAKRSWRPGRTDEERRKEQPKHEREEKPACKNRENCYWYKKNQCKYDHSDAHQKATKTSSKMVSDHFLEQVVAKAVMQVMEQIQKPGPLKTTTRPSYPRSPNQNRSNRF